MRLLTKTTALGWATEGVRKAIQAAQAAITAGIVVATSAGASGGS